MTHFRNADAAPWYLIAETIPQLFESKKGPVQVLFDLHGSPSNLYSLIPLSPELKSYTIRCQEILRSLLPLTGELVTQTIERQWIQQKFAVAWLEARTQIRSWNEIIDYSRRLNERTLENQSPSKTLIIDPGESDSPGQISLADDHYTKVFDWLGTTPLTYFRVDRHLRVKSLEAISMTDVKESGGYRFYPDFLHPAVGVIRDTDSIVIHIDPSGDLLIADKDGILATLRKGRWTIFDVDHLIATVAYVLDRKILHEIKINDPTCVACSLFQILFDISFKRHGGLLVIDRAENLSQYVVQGIRREGDSPLNSIFTHRTFNGLEFSIPEVRKLVELSSVDGALVLDTNGNLLEVGSFILPHPLAQNTFGTRDTAAYSAAKHGAASFKVSSDGQVSFYFTLDELNDQEVHRLCIM